MSLSWPAVVGTAINITVNTLGALGTGSFTVVVLTKPGGNHGHFGAKVASAFDVQQLNDSNIWFGGGDFSGFGTANNTDWHVIGHSKATGTNVYRWHYWNYSAGGAKTHTNGTGTHANPGTITAIQLGNSDNRGNGLIAAIAVWKRVLSDAEFDGLCTTNLSDWNALTPDAIWALNVAAASVVDGSGNGNNASSVTGTITSGAADPPSFNYALTGSQTITPGSIKPEERFGTGLLVPILSPGSMRPCEKFGTSLLVPLLSPGTVKPEERFGTSSLTPGVASATPGSVNTGERFGTSLLSPGAINLTPDSVRPEERFGTSLLSPGGVSSTPGTVQSSEQFGTSLLSPGVASFAPGSTVSQEQWGTASISSGGSPAQTLTPGSIASVESFGTDLLSPGAVSVAPGSMYPAEQFGTSNVGGVAAALASGSIGPQERWGASLLSAGSATLSPGSIAPLELWGRGILASDQTLLPGSIRSLELWGRATVGSNPPQTVTAGSIYPYERWGTSFIEYGARTPTHYVKLDRAKFDVDVSRLEFTVRLNRKAVDVEMEA